AQAVVRGQPQQRQEHQRGFQRVHLHPERALERGVATGGRCLDAVVPTREPHRGGGAVHLQHREQGDQGRQLLEHGASRPEGGSTVAAATGEALSSPRAPARERGHGLAEGREQRQRRGRQRRWRWWWRRFSARRSPPRRGRLLILVLLSLIFKRDLITPFLGGAGGVAQTTSGQAQPTQAVSCKNPASEQISFACHIMGSTEKTWGDYFASMGKTYVDPRLHLFQGQVATACGAASTAVGPFYCPGDRKVYLDLGFFQELQDRFHASGDFARAYVIAHEVGHHVQNLLGVFDKVQQLQ